MDPQQQTNTTSQSNTQPFPLPSAPHELPPYKPSHKKTIIIAIVAVVLLVGVGVGGYLYYQQQQQQQRLALIQEKKLANEKEAAERLKKLKQGTAKELETLIDIESKKESDTESLTIQHDIDAVNREAQLAIQIGSGNDKNL